MSSILTHPNDAGAAPDVALLRGILDAAPARVCVVGRDFRYRYVNREFCAFARKTPEQIIGLTTRELVGEEVARQLDPLAFAALAGETVVREGWIDYRLNGRKYIHWVFTPLRIASGEVTDFVVYMRDLTEHKEREEELARQNAYLQAILNGVADGVAVDRDGIIVLLNRGFARIFGLPEDLARPGLTSENFIRWRLSRGILYPHERPGTDVAEMAARARDRIREAGGSIDERYYINGRWLEVRRRHIPEAGGFVATYTDITARVEAEEARQAEREALREAQQMGATATLLGGVAHELNNPLSVVAAHATLLAEEAAGTPLADQAERVSAAARRCGRIVASLLASAQRRPPRRERLDLRRAIASAVDLLGHRLQAAEAALEVRLPKRLPRLTADPDQIVHLLANLIGNAAMALGQAPPPRRIAVTARRERGMLALRVADNGPGIPPELRERIFDAFFTTRPPGSGTGIGLALCRTIAQDHGGRIEAEETPGGGATLVVRLPLA
ncbi:MAG: PAS-domain containing protein [Acetobacteraceae bacterium]|nr:PAS-domain containing protein [Acetobacteraceae bacterium]